MDTHDDRDDHAVRVGRLLAAAMAHRGHTTTSIGRELGLSRATIHKWVSGRQMPSPERAQQLERALELPEPIVSASVMSPKVYDPFDQQQLDGWLRGVEGAEDPLEATYAVQHDDGEVRRVTVGELLAWAWGRMHAPSAETGR